MTIAFLGCGKLGEALLSGLLRAGHAPAEVSVTDMPARAADLAERYGVVVRTATEATVADILVLAVKPQDMATLLAELEAHVDPERHLVVSVAAGLTTSFFAVRLPAGTAVVRVMPNTPALVDEAMSAISAGADATDAQVEIVRALFAPVGKVVTVPEEQLDAVTALSGSGPAYFFYLVEAMIDAGIALGLSADVASELIVQTAVGAAVMLRDSGRTPAELRTAVSSPGGTTLAALSSMESAQIPTALATALRAARDRSRTLSAELS